MLSPVSSEKLTKKEEEWAESKNRAELNFDKEGSGILQKRQREEPQGSCLGSPGGRVFQKRESNQQACAAELCGR